MFSQKEILTRQLNGRTLLLLEMFDKNKVEYCDLDILKCAYLLDGTHYKMLGVIRFFAGRFEVVCPWKDQRFIMGLNPIYEIVGNLMDDSLTTSIGWDLIEQSKTRFKKENGVKA